MYRGTSVHGLLGAQVLLIVNGDASTSYLLCFLLLYFCSGRAWLQAHMRLCSACMQAIQGGPLIQCVKADVIPAGDVVFMSSYALGRSADIWEAPEEFRPVRFCSSSCSLSGLELE